VATRLPASTALAKIFITRPLMTFSIDMGELSAQALSNVGASQRNRRQRRDALEMGFLICRLY
jgi:hypothetical protein